MFRLLFNGLRSHRRHRCNRHAKASQKREPMNILIASHQTHCPQCVFLGPVASNVASCGCQLGKRMSLSFVVSKRTAVCIYHVLPLQLHVLEYEWKHSSLCNAAARRETTYAYAHLIERCRDEMQICSIGNVLPGVPDIRLV